MIATLCIILYSLRPSSNCGSKFWGLNNSVTLLLDTSQLYIFGRDKKFLVSYIKKIQVMLGLSAHLLLLQTLLKWLEFKSLH